MKYFSQSLISNKKLFTKYIEKSNHRRSVNNLKRINLAFAFCSLNTYVLTFIFTALITFSLFLKKYVLSLSKENQLAFDKNKSHWKDYLFRD